jgi:hypothetical protein
METQIKIVRNRLNEASTNYWKAVGIATRAAMEKKLTETMTANMRTADNEYKAIARELQQLDPTYFAND